MGIFDIFFKKRNIKSNDINFILKRLAKLSKKDKKNKDEFDNKIEIEKLYKNLSKILFKSVRNKNYRTIEKIFSNNFLIYSNLVDENGYNIIEYALFNDDNNLFKDLYNIYYDSIYPYLKNIPELFLIAMHRKNWDIIAFFLQNKNLSDYLKKENIADCLFNAIQSNQQNLISFLIDNFNDILDERNIEASMIYSISNNQKKELEMLFSYDTIASKFSPHSIEKLLVLSVINKNIDALEIIISNKYVSNLIETLDLELIKAILSIAYKNKNISIINMFTKNKKINGTLVNVLKIEE